MITGSINQEDITLVNIIHALAIGAPTYIKQLLTDIKRDINSNTLIIGDFNAPLTPMNRYFRQRINKETIGLKDTLEQIRLNRYSQSSLPQSSKIYILLKCTWNIFKDRPHVC